MHALVILSLSLILSLYLFPFFFLTYVQYHNKNCTILWTLPLIALTCSICQKPLVSRSNASSASCVTIKVVFIQGLADCIKRRSTADRTSVNPNWSVMSASVILPMLERSEASLEFPTSFKLLLFIYFLRGRADCHTFKECTRWYDHDHLPFMISHCLRRLHMLLCIIKFYGELNPLQCSWWIAPGFRNLHLARRIFW